MKGASGEELGHPFFVLEPSWRNLYPLWLGSSPSNVGLWRSCYYPVKGNSWAFKNISFVPAADQGPLEVPAQGYFVWGLGREEQGVQKSLLIAVIPIYRRILERTISFKGFI